MRFILTQVESCRGVMILIVYHLHIQVNSVHLYIAVACHMRHSCCRIFINNCHEIALVKTLKANRQL